MSEKNEGRQSVTVEIAGERHVLRADASPEYTQRVAAHVDETIRALGVGNTLDPHRAAILAALTITDELFREKQELETLRSELTRRAARLTKLLEKAPAREG
ncbi:MAG TPA: cell division protein ZapA [Longimicrobiaceae bacterium]|nr:cell division protein ZapA [Longimicrobiaceae bacterium]